MAGDNAEVKECVEDLKIMAGMYLRGEVEVGVLVVMLGLLRLRIRRAGLTPEESALTEIVAGQMHAESVDSRQNTEFRIEN